MDVNCDLTLVYSIFLKEKIVFYHVFDLVCECSCSEVKLSGETFQDNPNGREALLCRVQPQVQLADRAGGALQHKQPEPHRAIGETLQEGKAGWARSITSSSSSTVCSHSFIP